MIRSWLKPHNREIDLRERNLRFCLLVVIALWVPSFISTFVVFHNPVTLISTPTLLMLAGVLFGASAWLVQRGQVIASTWLLLGTAILGLTGMVVFDSYAYYAVPSILYLIFLLMMALLPDERVIIRYEIIIFAAFSVIAFVQYPIWVQNHPEIDLPSIIITRNLPTLAAGLIGAYLVRNWRLKPDQDEDKDQATKPNKPVVR